MQNNSGNNTPSEETLMTSGSPGAFGILMGLSGGYIKLGLEPARMGALDAD